MRPPDPSDAALRRFAAPERAAAEVTELRPAALKRIVERNRATDETVYTISSNVDLNNPKLVRIDAIDLEIGHTMLKRFRIDRKSTRLNSSHGYISYAVFCLKKKNK